jgi:hypothetical protein
MSWAMAVDCDVAYTRRNTCNERPEGLFTEPKEANMADDRVIQIAVSPGTQEFPDEVYLLYQSGAVFHGSLSEEGWKWNEVSLPQGEAFHPTSFHR